MHPLDADGWLIPRHTTKSRRIYDLAKTTWLKPRQIATEVGMSAASVRVILSRLRHPHKRRKLRPAPKKLVRAKIPCAGKSIVFSNLR